jgi:O-antigen ligase
MYPTDYFKFRFIMKKIQPIHTYGQNLDVCFSSIILRFLAALLVTLYYLSGGFSLSRIGLGVLEVRYIFAVMLVCYAIIFVPKFRSISISKPNFGLNLSFFIFMWLFFATFWTLNQVAAFERLVDLFMMFFSVIFTLMVFSRHPKAIVYLLYLLLIVGLLYSAISIFSAAERQGRGSIVLGGPNVATRVIFFGLVAAAALFHIYRKLFYLAPLPILTAGIITIGSRGGMVGLLVVLLYSLVLIYFSNRRIQFKLGFKEYMFGTLFSFFAYLYLFPIVRVAFEVRFIRLLVDRVHYAGRDSLYNTALNMILERPLSGYGLGGYIDNGFWIYPHNLILELALDGGVGLGLLGILLFAYTLVLPFRVHGLAKVFSLAMVYMIVVQQFSGGYYDFRYYYLFLVLTVCSKKLYVLVSNRSGNN